MFVRRKTMERALARQEERHERERLNYYAGFTQAIRETTALQGMLEAWIIEKADSFTPEQMADLFYSHDDSWQAAFFNAMQGRIQARHDAMPPRGCHEFRLSPGVPAGETQWCFMADKLNESGFETLRAMFEHAQAAHDRRAV